MLRVIAEMIGEVRNFGARKNEAGEPPFPGFWRAWHGSLLRVEVPS